MSVNSFDGGMIPSYVHRIVSSKGMHVDRVKFLIVMWQTQDRREGYAFLDLSMIGALYNRNSWARIITIVH